MRANQLEVLPGDVVVVLLHFLEGGLVRLHQIIDVLILALLDLVHFDFHAEIQLSPQVVQLLVVRFDEIKTLFVEYLLLRVKFVDAVLLVDLDLAVSLLLGLDVVVLLLLLHLHHFDLALVVLFLLLKHDFVRVGLDLLLTVAVVVLEMAHLLHEDLEFCAMTLLLRLHVRVEVLDAGIQLLDFGASIVVEVVDHVLLHLQQVTIQLGVDKLLAIRGPEFFERLTV